MIPPASASPPASMEALGTLVSESRNSSFVGPINILLVDDEPKNLTALETVLNDTGYRLVKAGSADEALLQLVAQEFAVLVLDIQMPGMNGFELASMIKQRKKTAGIPIIFLTAYYSEDEHVIEGYSTGAVDFLHKPINPVVLRSKVAVFADLYRKSREVAEVNRSLTTEMVERLRAEEQLQVLNDELEQRILDRTQKLSASEERFRALAEDMPHLVWEMDSEGRTIFHNSRWSAYSGLKMNGQPNGWLERVHPEDLDPVRSSWARALETGEECDSYFRYLRAEDGQARWFHFKAVPVIGNQGSVDHWVATSTDIHEQRKAEEALREADQRKDEFLAMLGHELRNPLAAIRHAISISRETRDDASVHDWALEVIDRQSHQLARMVDDLLDVERINRGRIELQFDLVELHEVLAHAIEAVKPVMERKNHSLQFHRSGEAVYLQGDVTRLEQVFVNLLNNAAKYTPEGGEIEISLALEGQEAAVSVTDNGIGIPADLMPHIFELFTQAQSSLDRSEGGLGIGLTVVRALVELHGGLVLVQPQNHRVGTSFCVRLPTTVPSEAHLEARKRPQIEESAARKIKVLVVDDHVDGAQTLARLLSRKNCEVRVAHDGPGGIIAAKEFHPEVLLLDLGLPGFDGFQLAKILSEDPSCRGSLFIAVSGYAQEGDREKAAEAGFHHHCAKPVDFKQLLAVIRSSQPALAS